MASQHRNIMDARCVFFHLTTSGWQALELSYNTNYQVSCFRRVFPFPFGSIDGTDDFIYSSQYDCLLRDGLLQYTGDQEKENLRIAFGAGKGKHASKRRRRHTNKYSSKSKAAKDDPWEQQLRLAEETSGEDKARERLEIEEREARRFQRRIERGDVIYPDEEDIDPYDPSSFGYIEVALFYQILADCTPLRVQYLKKR